MDRMAPESMRITGTAEDWSDWAGIALRESGAYAVPGALSPVVYDADTDLGVYIEPNVWMIHDVARSSSHQHD